VFLDDDSWVAESLNFDKDYEASVFETTIRSVIIFNLLYYIIIQNTLPLDHSGFFSLHFGVTMLC
jgi:hypothetical protein